MTTTPEPKGEKCPCRHLLTSVYGQDWIDGPCDQHKTLESENERLKAELERAERRSTPTGKETACGCVHQNPIHYKGWEGGPCAFHVALETQLAEMTDINLKIVEANAAYVETIEKEKAEIGAQLAEAKHDKYTLTQVYKENVEIALLQLADAQKRIEKWAGLLTQRDSEIDRLTSQLADAQKEIERLKMPGTPEGFINGMFDLAEQHGHPRSSSKHPLTFLREEIERLRELASIATKGMEAAAHDPKCRILGSDGCSCGSIEQFKPIRAEFYRLRR